MDGFGDQVLAGAAFALNEDGGGLAGGNLADEVHQLGHFRRHADHAVIADTAAHFSAQRLDLVTQAGLLQRVLDDNPQLVEFDGLAHEVVGPELERGFHIVQLGVGGNHDDGPDVATFFEPVEHFDAGEVRQAHVEKHQVGRLALCQQERRFAGFGFDDEIAPLLAFLAERPAHQALVVHNHDFLR